MRLLACALFLFVSLLVAVLGTDFGVVIAHKAFFPWLTGLFSALACIAVLLTIDEDSYD